MFQSVSLFKLRAFARLIWVRIALISALAIVAAAAAPLLSPLLPDGMRDRIDEAAVSDLLSVLSGSMLAVATFSLSVMVSAHHFAASQVTPRAHRLLRNDARTQSVLATFIGAFVFSLMAVVILNAGLFGGRDFAVLYGMTMVVIGFVIVALVRWVQQISNLGSVEQTTDRVEGVVIAAMRERMDVPWLGGRCAVDTGPSHAISIFAQRFGWVAHVDMDRLSDLAEEIGATIHLHGVPGLYVTPGTELMGVDVAQISVAQQDALAAAVLVQERRDFDQDPGFGIEVMSEIAQRALSPGLNDPRTATDVITRQLRILSLWTDGPDSGDHSRFPRVHVPPLTVETLLREGLDSIARDGAHLVEVQVAVQQALTVLARHPSDEMSRGARTLSARCLQRSDAALDLPQDRCRVRAAGPGAQQASQGVPEMHSGTARRPDLRD